MTVTTAHQRQHPVTAAEQAKARSVVLRHARDGAEAAELLAMLGLDDQQDITPRGRGRRTGRQPVHALSAATEARLASPDQPANHNGRDTLPEAATPPTTSRSEAIRRCEGCEVPVVPQTRYRLDPAGYQRQGIKLLAAKKRCHRCYNRQRREDFADAAVPADPRHCENCERPMVTAHVFSANPDRWRARGWQAHAAHGVCRNCRSAADGRRLRALRRDARRAPRLCDLVDQLTSLRRQVQHLRRAHPDDVPLACMATALGEARRHLDAASVRVATGPDDTQAALGEPA